VKLHFTFAALILVASCVGEEDGPPSALEVPAHFPEPIIPADNPYEVGQAELGRHLFYDTRLSVNGAISCASCHQPELAFADDSRVSDGALGDAGALNAPSLANAVYSGPLTWSRASISTIEEQLHGPMFGDAPIEMGMAGHEAEILERIAAEPRYRELGADELDIDGVRYALATFVRSLLSHRAPFDEFLLGDRNALSPAAQRGSELFFSDRLGCGSCHAGFALTNAITSKSSPLAPEAYHNIGLYNVDGAGGYPNQALGLIADSGLARDMGRFRVPSLRNVAVTAPYMHDGSVTTLEDVVQIYEDGGRDIVDGPFAGDGRENPLRSERLKSFELTNAERSEVIAFLESLTDEAFLSDQSYANPW